MCTKMFIRCVYNICKDLNKFKRCRQATEHQGVWVGPLRLQVAVLMERKIINFCKAAATAAKGELATTWRHLFVCKCVLLLGIGCYYRYICIFGLLKIHLINAAYAPAAGK